MRRLSGTLGFKGGALYWYAVGVGSALTFFMFWEWVNPKSVAKWWEPLSAVATACAAIVALLLGTADARRRKRDRRQNARTLRVYLEAELHTVRSAAALFINLVDAGVIAPTAPAFTPTRRQQLRRFRLTGRRSRGRVNGPADPFWKKALPACAEKLAMPATQQQFEMFSCLPEVQAAVLAGIAAEAARLRSGLLDWIKRADHVPFDGNLVGIFRSNAATLIGIIDRLEWMRDDATLSSFE